MRCMVKIQGNVPPTIAGKKVEVRGKDDFWGKTTKAYARRFATKKKAAPKVVGDAEPKK